MKRKDVVRVIALVTVLLILAVPVIAILISQ